MAKKDKVLTADAGWAIEGNEDLGLETSAGGDFWKAADYENRLHLVKPTGSGKEDTSMGESEVIYADIVVLDEHGEDHEVFTDAKVFQTGLRGALSGPLRRGTRLVGRLGKGIAKPGKSAPWTFLDATAADKAVAVKFIQSGNPL